MNTKLSQGNTTLNSPSKWGGRQVPISSGSTENSLLIIGIPFDGGAGEKRGASEGPDKLRQLSHRLKTISRRGVDVSHLEINDYGNLTVEGFELDVAIDRIYSTYKSILSKNNFCVLSIGGDHSVTFPIVKAASECMSNEKIGLIWFDAHPDCLDIYRNSKFSHGSPLRRIVENGCVTGENVLLVGTRAYDRSEREFIFESGITEIPSIEFSDNRLEALERYKRSLVEIKSRTDKLYVTIDIDVLEACLVPGTGTPVPDGLGVSDLLSMIELIEGDVFAYDIVEFSPRFDISDITAYSILSIVTTILAAISKNS